MADQAHHQHELEDPGVCSKVGYFFIAVVAALFLLAFYN